MLSIWNKNVYFWQVHPHFTFYSEQGKNIRTHETHICIVPTRKAPEPPPPSYVDICENMEGSDEVDGRSRYIWSLEVWAQACLIP